MSGVAPPPPLDPLRTKLVHLIDQIHFLHSHLQHLALSTPAPSTSAPGILPFPDLLNRYNLLLAAIVGLGGLLSDVALRERTRDERRRAGKAEETTRERDAWRDVKRERWEGAVVVPAREVEESKEWIVGLLLRTKQTPQVEAHLAALQANLPPQFLDPTTYSQELAKHQGMVRTAHERIQRIMIEMDGEEWDWKARVEGIEEDEEDVDEDEEMAEPTPVALELTVGRTRTLAELSSYQRTGVLPP